MKLAYALLILTALSAMLAGCGSTTAPALVVDNQPTLVYIYTEG